MGLFSFLHKNKQDAAPGKSEYRSQSDEPFSNARSRAKRSNQGGKDASSDPILPEKKRARRRLIGAVVLVLAVVIVLPMILDPEPKPLTDDISVQIPSRDASPATPAIVGAGAQADTASLDAKEELVDAGSASKPAEKPAVKVAEAPVAPVAAVVEKPKSIEKPPVKQEEKPTEKSAAPAKAEKTQKPEKAEKTAPATETKHAAPASAAVKPSEEQRALAILQGKSLSADKPSAQPSGKFVIQVAALATQEKVDELRGKLKTAGINSYTQKVATKAGDRTRIRVGPFASRDEADKTRAKIVKLGLNATLVPT